MYEYFISFSCTKNGDLFNANIAVNRLRGGLYAM